MANQIYGLIGKAMQKIGAIGKDSRNVQQGFMYRGIDAVYNALNPVMAELGLFICPEILEQRREERTTKNGTALTYSILTIKYTIYAPDGSSVSCTVVGEGMDSGDKASNKAMSVAMKYAMFQLFFIPTEAVDPDSEVHLDVMPKKQANNTPVAAQVQNVPTVPQTAQEQPKNAVNPVLEYLAHEQNELKEARKISKAENAALWNKQIEVLRAAKIIPDRKLSTYTMDEAKKMIQFMYTRFDPTGTELKPLDGQTA